MLVALKPGCVNEFRRSVFSDDGEREHTVVFTPGIPLELDEQEVAACQAAIDGGHLVEVREDGKGLFRTVGTGRPVNQAPPAVPEPDGTEPSTPEDSESPTLATREAEVLAADLGVDISSVQGTGEGGRILVGDVRSAHEELELRERIGNEENGGGADDD